MSALTGVEASMSDESRLSVTSDANLRAVIELRRRNKERLEAQYLRAKFDYDVAVDELAHRSRMRRS